MTGLQFKQQGKIFHLSFSHTMIFLQLLVTKATTHSNTANSEGAYGQRIIVQFRYTTRRHPSKLAFPIQCLVPKADRLLFHICSASAADRRRVGCSHLRTRRAHNDYVWKFAFPKQLQNCNFPTLCFLA